MAQQREQELVKGFTGKQVFGSKTPLIIGIGVKKQEFIDQILAIPENERGWIQLSLKSKKGDPEKVYLFKDKEDAAPSRQSSSTPPPPPPSSTSSFPTDDLPF